MGRKFLGTLVGPTFLASIISPLVVHWGVSDGFWTRNSICSASGSWSGVSFLIQKFCTWSCPGAFQFVSLWQVVEIFSSVISSHGGSSTSVILSFSSLIQPASSLCFVSSPYIPPQNFIISSPVGGFLISVFFPYLSAAKYFFWEFVYSRL